MCLLLTFNVEKKGVKIPPIKEELLAFMALANFWLITIKFPLELKGYIFPLELKGSIFRAKRLYLLAHIEFVAVFAHIQRSKVRPRICTIINYPQCVSTKVYICLLNRFLYVVELRMRAHRPRYINKSGES